MQVRFLPPQLDTEGRANGRWQPSRKRPSSDALRVRLPLLPLVCPWPSGQAPVFQTGEVGSTPTGHSRGSANGRPAVFEAAYEGSTPSPRTLRDMVMSRY